MMAREEAVIGYEDAASSRNHTQPEALVRAAYALLADGNIGGLATLLADQAVAYEYDRAGHRATYRGVCVILKRLEDLAPSYWDAVRVRMHAIVSAGPLTAALASWQGTSRLSSQSYALRHVLVVRITQHQITGLWLIRDAPVPTQPPSPPPRHSSSSGETAQ